MTSFTRRSAAHDHQVVIHDSAALALWLRELERFDSVLAAQTAYLDAVADGAVESPPEPFVGTVGLPQLPSSLGPYARDLVQRNDAILRRAEALSAQLRPRERRPMAVASGSARGTILERQA